MQAFILQNLFFKLVFMLSNAELQPFKASNCERSPNIEMTPLQDDPGSTALDQSVILLFCCVWSHPLCVRMRKGQVSGHESENIALPEELNFLKMDSNIPVNAEVKFK